MTNHALPSRAAILIAGASIATLAGCTTGIGAKTAESRGTPGSPNPTSVQNNALLYSESCITEAEVIAAQKAWGEGIVAIGKVMQDNGDYVRAAAEHIEAFYAYDLTSVLFKPTLASEKQFRNSFDAALSYFVGGNPTYPEDKGFALKPWKDVRWENAGIINNNCKMAVAMGNYFFAPADGTAESKVEYTFAYVKDRNDNLKIAVHQSSLPFQGGG